MGQQFYSYEFMKRNKKIYPQIYMFKEEYSFLTFKTQMKEASLTLGTQQQIMKFIPS
jgi:hypothetical protein